MRQFYAIIEDAAERPAAGLAQPASDRRQNRPVRSVFHIHHCRRHCAGRSERSSASAPARSARSKTWRASATGEVIFENCRVAPEQLVGKKNDGFVDSLKVLDGGRVSIAALSIGMAQGAYDAALKYSKLRKQFGRPISEFQAIQHKLVDMAVDLDAARLLNYRAAWMLDHKKRVTRESAMAKLFASEAAVRIANEAVQIHGGYGFIKDYPVEKFYRDVKLCTIGEGTSEIQRLVIARQLLAQ